MYVDNNLVVSGSVSSAGVVAGQTVTGAAGNYLSTNTIDLQNQRNIGAGNDFVRMRSEVLTAFTGLTSLEMRIVTADDAALSTNVTVIGSTGAIPVASLTLGARFEAEINTRFGSRGQRYLGVQYAIVGTGTAGAVFTDFGPDLQGGQDFYPSGFSVL